jgi:dihydrofolate reductase
MRRLIMITFLTLDGVMQAPGAPGEDDEGGFAYGGWMAGYSDEVADRTMGELMGRPFDLLLGRKTYDIFAAYWPHHADGTVGKPFDDATKYVASGSRPTLSWDDSVLLEGDLASEVARLKQDDGPELQVWGSGNLAQTLIQHGLIDQFVLWIHPLVLGSGKRLFEQGTVPAALSLVDSRVSTTGVVIGTYEPAGEVVTGVVE